MYNLELHRVFPPVPAAATAAQAEAQRDAIANQLVTELRAVIADLRQDRDHWREAFQRLLQIMPTEANSSRLVLTIGDMREAVERAFAATDGGG